MRLKAGRNSNRLCLSGEERRTETGSRTNIYHLDGLIEAAAPFAEEKLAEMKDKFELAKRRENRRGAPKLRLVTDDDE